MLMFNCVPPDPDNHLNHFVKMLEEYKPFSFVRFSDGEIEILRNRYVEINGGKTVYKGRVFSNNFPKFDEKKFDPKINKTIRKDLLSSALFKGEFFYKGIPTAHNNAINDREFLLRLNGGFDFNMTFSDLFLNSNYLLYRRNMVPLFEKYERIYVVANYRAKPIGLLSKAKHITIPDNFFANYDKVIQDVWNQIKNVKNGSLILSSASSLSKILGHMLYIKNTNITFLDIGTSINDLLSLSHNTRAYHQQDRSILQRILYRKSKGYNIRW